LTAALPALKELFTGGFRDASCLLEKTPAHSRDFSRELAGQLYFFIIYMVNPY
jgi:hypothetical protein